MFIYRKERKLFNIMSDYVSYHQHVKSNTDLINFPASDKAPCNLFVSKAAKDPDHLIV